MIGPLFTLFLLCPDENVYFALRSYVHDYLRCGFVSGKEGTFIYGGSFSLVLLLHEDA